MNGSEAQLAKDYSYDGNAISRSPAYRWGKDGLAGICEDQQQ